MILQISELFTDIAQLGIVFTLLVAIIFVLARRIVKLENENKAQLDEIRASEKESIIIIKDATEAMTKIIKTIENGRI